MAAWFFWLLQPERRVRRPRGPLPAKATWIEHIPETMLERVVVPTGNLIMQVSTAARRLQHGRLQSYILYLVAGLVVLGIIVLLGGTP